MIQCVGCRNEDRNYCSRICCGQAVKNALKLKEKNPELDIFVLFRDMRTYGLQGGLLPGGLRASDVKFIRWETEDPPHGQARSPRAAGRCMRVGVTDPILGMKMAIDADALVLSAAVIPDEGTKEVAGQFKVTLNPDELLQGGPRQAANRWSSPPTACSSAAWPSTPSTSPSPSARPMARPAGCSPCCPSDSIVASGAICEVEEERLHILRGLHHRLHLRRH